MIDPQDGAVTTREVGDTAVAEVVVVVGLQETVAMTTVDQGGTELDVVIREVEAIEEVMGVGVGVDIDNSRTCMGAVEGIMTGDKEVVVVVTTVGISEAPEGITGVSNNNSASSHITNNSKDRGVTAPVATVSNSSSRSPLMDTSRSSRSNSTVVMETSQAMVVTRIMGDKATRQHSKASCSKITEPNSSNSRNIQITTRVILAVATKCGQMAASWINHNSVLFWKHIAYANHKILCYAFH